MQGPDFSPKKLPTQDRSRATFEAIVGAATWLLPRRGYAGTTTNHIADRAGVNVSSLYEYFPGKDAIVAQVAQRLVERVMARLAEGPAASQESAERVDFRFRFRNWIELIHDTVARERKLVAVFIYQVPYTNQLAPVQAIGPRLVEFSSRLRSDAGNLVRPDFSSATLHLVINLISSTILQLVLDPPDDVSERELLDELIRRAEGWIREV
jgi:AcrR family transcriptional regulator